MILAEKRKKNRDEKNGEKIVDDSVMQHSVYKGFRSVGYADNEVCSAHPPKLIRTKEM